MADQYEIREDSSKKYWPFTVFNLTKGWEVGRRFATREDAQAEIDKLSRPVEFDEDLFNMIPDPDDPSWGQAQSKPEQKEAEDEIVIDSQETVGSIIEFHGDKWLVVSSRYITAKEAADLEDGWDAYVQPGWDTVLRKVKPDDKSLEVVAEQVQSGNARLEYRQGKQGVLFLDEQQFIPLDDLAYSSDLGLYQKSKFPGWQRGTHE